MVRNQHVTRHRQKLYINNIYLNCDCICLLYSIEKLGILLIYISTNYVFDGTKPPYKPSDAPNPLNKYGQSKRDGEIATLEHYPGKLSSSFLLCSMNIHYTVWNQLFPEDDYDKDNSVVLYRIISLP